jgi:hypothetical protein
VKAVSYKKVKRYFKDVDIRSAFWDHLSFKVSFGLSFALASFGSLD